MNTAAETESATEIFIESLRKVNGEIESAIETLEVLSDSETLKAIEEGMQDIKAGRVIRFEEFLKKHGYQSEEEVILKKMQKISMDKNWKAFSNWERTYKREAVKTLTVDSAFALFSELWEAQTKFSATEIEKFRERKIEELIMLRKSFNLIQKRLHA